MVKASLVIRNCRYAPAVIHYSQEDKRMAKPMKNWNFRMREEERERIKQAAEAAGFDNAADFVRYVLRIHCELILGK